MDWHDRIVVNPKVLVGRPVIQGTRIAVAFVVDLLGCGWTAAVGLGHYELNSEYPKPSRMAGASIYCRSGAAELP